MAKRKLKKFDPAAGAARKQGASPKERQTCRDLYRAGYSVDEIGEWRQISNVAVAEAVKGVKRRKKAANGNQ